MCMTAAEKEKRKKVLEEVTRCSEKKGNKLDKGLVVFRGDTRSMNKIQKAGGFVPSTLLEKGENLLQRAQKQADEILKLSPRDFINAWKYSSTASGGIRDLVVGERGRLAGVSCGILEGQKGGNEYKISVPVPLYVVGRKQERGFTIAVYGNAPELKECTILAMHFILMQNAEEFVFLTNVPMEWIEECK